MLHPDALLCSCLSKLKCPGPGSRERHGQCDVCMLSYFVAVAVQAMCRSAIGQCRLHMHKHGLSLHCKDAAWALHTRSRTTAYLSRHVCDVIECSQVIGGGWFSLLMFI